jgi:AraC family transcriptional regulator of adaptative response / DNA-3-methyladenine glycosylase II
MIQNSEKAMPQESLDNDACYHALKTRDSRFDGVFFVGVSSTGIYCRPVCRARLPRQENCGFYPSAAAAERAGFRPCLLCRPELAPGKARTDAVGRLASLAAAKIEGGDLADSDIPQLAETLGISDRHLRRVLQNELGVTPIGLAQTQRLLRAKQLLTDTRLSVTEVALASGFTSLRRFNALFQERYRLTPSSLRKQSHLPERRTPMAHGESIVCELGYRPPFDFDFFRRFLAGRIMKGVEEISEESYRRTVEINGKTGWISVHLAERGQVRPTLRVEASASLLTVLAPVLERVKRLFDLSAEPQSIVERLGSLAAENPGIRVPGAFDGYEAALRAILGQQISVKAATTIAGRVAAAFGEPIETPFPNLTHLPPKANRIADAAPERLIALGITSARANSILALSKAVTGRLILLEPTTDIEPVLARLQEIPGIGAWTAQYIALRAPGSPDAFLPTDLGVMKALGETNPKRILQIAEEWRPWRAYAVMHLWNSLG